MLMQYPVTCEYNSWHEHIPISTEDLYSFLSLHFVYFNCIFLQQKMHQCAFVYMGTMNVLDFVTYIEIVEINDTKVCSLSLKTCPSIKCTSGFFFWCFVFVFTAARDSCTTLVNALVNSTSKYWWSVFVYFPDPMNL